MLGEKAGVIIALDLLDLKKALDIVTRTHDLVNGYKIGFSLGLSFGLPTVAAAIRKIANVPLIYDHQKAATDIPDTAVIFAEACKSMDAIIFVPQSGPKTLEAWVKAVQNVAKTVIVCGEMTHPGFLRKDGGYLCDDAPERIYKLASQLGVTHFVVPGNKAESIRKYIDIIIKSGVKNPVLYSPGLITQGGILKEARKAAGTRWQAIIGRAIITAKDPRSATKEIIDQIQ